MRANYYPEASAALDAAFERNPALGRPLDDALDLIEQDPPSSRAKRRAWIGGVFGVEAHSGGEEWIILWKDTNPPTILYIGESAQI